MGTAVYRICGIILREPLAASARAALKAALRKNERASQRSAFKLFKTIRSTAGSSANSLSNCWKRHISSLTSMTKATIRRMEYVFALTCTALR
jgi:hypothetical protein